MAAIAHPIPEIFAGHVDLPVIASDGHEFEMFDEAAAAATFEGATS